jgi:hypothetical protein
MVMRIIEGARAVQNLPPKVVIICIIINFENGQIGLKLQFITIKGSLYINF